MRFNFFVLSFLLILTACSGQSPSKANFNFVVSGKLTASAKGGLVIFGKNTKGDKFSRVLLTNSGAGSVTEELPRGTWSFGAVAWAGTKAFTGTISCAFQINQQISSDKAEVSLSLTNSRCFESDVVTPGTYSGSTTKTFAALTANFCESDVSTRTTSLCSYTETIRPIERGMAGSYSFVFAGARAYAKSDVTLIKGELLESSCYGAATNAEPIAASYFANELNIPAFLPAVGFPLRLRAHLGAACETTKGALWLSLADPTEVKFYSYSAGFMYIHARTSASALCSTSDSFSNPNSPAAGNGSMASPWLLCTEEQLLAVQKNFAGSFDTVSVLGGVFVLGRNMNLQKFVKAGTVGTNPAHACLRDGDTFVPIGKTYSAFPGCSLGTSSTSSSFRFDGNGKTISHFRFKDDNEHNVGFISGLFGGIYDINFSKAEIEGRDTSGIVAGQVTGGLVKNIRVTDSYMRGEDEVGGMIGKANGSPNIYLLRADKMEIEGWTSVGGLIGSMTTGQITDASFNGDIYAKDNGMNLGGIIGTMMGTMISRVATSGSIHSNSVKMGGIAGTANGVEFARSDMMIHDYGSTGTRYLGGIVGYHTSSNTQRSLYNGVIKTACSSSCQTGSIDGFAVSPPSVSYSTFDDPAQGGRSGDTSTYDDVATVQSSSLSTDLCSGYGPLCPLYQVNGDIPRFTDLEPAAETPCSQALNNDSIASQTGRGSAANPYIICHPGQLTDLIGSSANFEIKANLNLTGVSIPLGNFSGTLSGKGQSLFGLDVSGVGVDAALFDDISGKITNLRLQSFTIDSPTCGSICRLAPLGLSSSGIIKNVRVDDIEITAPHSFARAAGLIADNSGTIDKVSTRGRISSSGRIGGISLLNFGTIKSSTSQGRLNGQDAASSSYVGGVVADNYGTISKTRFRGVIENVSSSQYVGGIAGFLSAGSILADNEFHVEGEILFSSGTTYAGGIAGGSVTGASITRNLTRGFFKTTSGFSPTVHALIGGGTVTSTANYLLSVPLKTLESGLVSTPTFTALTRVCSMVIARSIGNSLATVVGTIEVNFERYQGSLVDTGSNYTFSTTTKDNSECTGLTGMSASMYVPITGETPQTPTIAAMKIAGWDIASLLVSDDADRAFKAYLDLLTGNDPKDPPVWIFDRDDNGLKLFTND